MHCKTLLHSATKCKIPEETEEYHTFFNTLQQAATHHETLQHTARYQGGHEEYCASFYTLQHTASHRTTLQQTATQCDTHPNTKRNIGVPYFLQHTATQYNTLHHTAKPATQLQHTVTHIKILEGTYQYRASFQTLQQGATHCNTLQRNSNALQHTSRYREEHRGIVSHSTHCNTLHYTATHCNTHQDTGRNIGVSCLLVNGVIDKQRLQSCESVCFSVLQCIAVYCSVLQCVAIIVMVENVVQPFPQHAIYWLYCTYSEHADRMFLNCKTAARHCMPHWVCDIHMIRNTLEFAVSLLLGSCNVSKMQNSCKTLHASLSLNHMNIANSRVLFSVLQFVKLQLPSRSDTLSLRYSYSYDSSGIAPTR